MAFELFGFEIKSKKEKGVKTFVTPENLDGAQTVVEGGGIHGHYLNLDIDAKDENLLVQKYREMVMTQECDAAVDDIVNEAVIHEDGKPAISINLENINQGSAIKDKIGLEFKTILKLLDFNQVGHDLFKKWYVDARIYHHIVVDSAKVKEGIKELIPIDALNIKKVREVTKHKDEATGVDIVEKVEEYFVYTPETTGSNAFAQTIIPSQQNAVKVSPDAICYLHSGLIEDQKQIVIGYLYKAIKPFNQLRMIEDALVIYRLARAPERRIFYIDVGNLPKLKAEQYLRSVMDRYKQKIVYNASTGEVEDQTKQMSMLEDFWLPRREGGRGTEISTLPSGQNLGEIEDIEYFRKKLYQALNVPISRIEGTEQTAFNLGRATEITRDELKFTKFVAKLRHRFSHLFTYLLKVQLILKGIIKEEDWFDIKDNLAYVWTRDSHFSELKNNEIFRERLEILQSMDEYIGKYFSDAWVRKNVLKHTPDEIQQIDRDIRKSGSDPDDFTINPDLINP